MTLQAGWKTVTGNELFSFVTSGSRGWAQYYSDHGDVFVRIGDLNRRSLSVDLLTAQRVVAPQSAEGVRTQLRSGDILISITADIGTIAVVPEGIPTAYINQHIALARPRGPVNPTYLGWYLAAESGGQRQFQQLRRGAIKAGLGLDDIRAVNVPLPPLPEQHRIVAAIEQHFSCLDAAVASLERVKVNLKRARASVLKAAVEGRLVPTEAALAKAEHRTFEPASVLLARILEERRRRWLESGKKGAYKEPVKPETEGLPALPEGWVWASLEQIGDGQRSFGYGVLVPGPDVPDGIPFVRVGDIGDGVVSPKPEKTISRAIADKFSRTYLQGGELLLSLVGTIGRAGIAPDTLAGANVARAVGVLPLSRIISKRYVQHAILSPEAHSRLLGAAHEVARKTLNMEDVRLFALPLPPLAEQHRIVAEVDRRLSVLDKIEASVELNLARCARLRQSILKRAFEGRLVNPETPAVLAASAHGR